MGYSWFQVFNDYKFGTNVVEKFGAFKSNLWLTTEFHLCSGKLPFYKSLLPKIIRCDNIISRLYLYRSENLKFEYFTKLTESGKVKRLEICETKIVGSQNAIVPIEEIFKYALYASAIMINPAFLTKQTLKILNSSKHGCKLGDLSLHGINNMLDVDDFLEFKKVVYFNN
uniref:Uncharacterized protein n=1 Tax=Panagrolaimus davidi TaxID=227884 RepID=A0A914QDP3_9BILA